MPIKIEVPFHKHMETTGVKEYMAANLHHCSLVNIIKECTTDPHLGSTFHMEPYKLLWWPSEDHPEIRLHGELYTSDASIKEHQALQDSPGEPRCNLPCIVVRCMVYSDSTHLMAFGNNHLWPCYFHFGNDTKLRVLLVYQIRTRLFPWARSSEKFQQFSESIDTVY